MGLENFHGDVLAIDCTKLDGALDLVIETLHKGQDRWEKEDRSACSILFRSSVVLLDFPPPLGPVNAVTVPARMHRSRPSSARASRRVGYTMEIFELEETSVTVEMA